MNRSSKFNFFLPQNTDPIEVSDFNSNFETIDANLLTKEQSLSDAQKAAVRANVDLNVANNLTTDAAGSVLDARQGKALNDRMASAITSVGPGTSGTIETLADLMIASMTVENKIYLFRSSWPNHPNGYIGYGFKCDSRYYGHVIDGSSNVYDFYKTLDGDVVIKNYNQILEKTVTGTTGSTGAINLDLPWATYEIVSLTSPVANQYCLVVQIGASQYARVLTDGSTYSVVANQSVTVNVKYRRIR